MGNVCRQVSRFLYSMTHSMCVHRLNVPDAMAVKTASWAVPEPLAFGTVHKILLTVDFDSVKSQDSLPLFCTTSYPSRRNGSGRPASLAHH